MSEAVVTYEETMAALAMFREWEGIASDIDAMWAVLKADREAQAAVAAEPEWEYGWHTGSTVSLIGRRDQVEEWLTVRGWKLGEGDWGSRVMRRRVAGSWMPAEQDR